MANSNNFDTVFRALTGNAPFPWQQQLYQRMIRGEFPDCAIPTGLGKTAVAAIWLIALAQNPCQVPRRLVYVVNRRTVVDQTTVEVEKLRNNLSAAGLNEALGKLCGFRNGVPLAISTLRGQYADNQEWSADPSRPAVICGTVDMIGSRLLFSGYRIGFRSRPLHAGFLGQDALLVHDEAHLEPAFQELVESIEREQHEHERTGELPWPKLRLMALTATARNGNAEQEAAEVFALTDREREPPARLPDPPTEPIHHVWRRLKAKKSLRLHEVPADKIADHIAKVALEQKDANVAVLIYVRTIDDVLKVCGRLTDKKNGIPQDRVQQLTGTMRGFERDRMANPRRPDGCRVFARFLTPPKPDAAEDERWKVEPMPGTVYLVSTSAGEVGIDISADHMVCDLSTFESMVQRFGRVNRAGDCNSSITVVYPEEFDEKDKLATVRQATLELLQRLDGDASPLAIDRLDPALRLAAFAPKPAILPVSDILFDAWAMTTIREQMPGRPPVAKYLHGVAEWEPPETHIAWRRDVGIIKGDLLERYDPKDLLDNYPLKPHELLRDRSDRVFDTLQRLAGRHPAEPVWVLDDRGRVTIWQLAELADPSATQAAARKPLIARIEDCTVLLDPTIGGLTRGMLDAKSDHADDVADIEAPQTERRLRLWSDEEGYDARTAGMRLVRSVDMPRNDSDDDQSPTWDWYKHKPIEDTRTAQKPVLWDIHVRDAIGEVDRILAGLSLPDDIARAVATAVKLHDHGKRRLQFQVTLGNRAYPHQLLAKSGRTGAKLPETCRHEFGSLADAADDPEFQELSPDMQDLVLHLIAAHHGRARPHFPRQEAYDPAPGRTQANADQLACEVPRRFARLQRRYGRWGLAYLESLLRAADWAASSNPSEYLTDSNEVSR